MLHCLDGRNKCQLCSELKDISKEKEKFYTFCNTGPSSLHCMPYEISTSKGILITCVVKIRSSRRKPTRYLYSPGNNSSSGRSNSASSRWTSGCFIRISCEFKTLALHTSRKLKGRNGWRTFLNWSMQVHIRGLFSLSILTIADVVVPWP